MKRFVLALVALCALSGCYATYTPYPRRVYYGPGYYYGPVYSEPPVVVVPRYEGRHEFYHEREFHGGWRR